MFICKFCSKECKNNNSLINHERYCKLNPNKQESWFEKFQPAKDKRSNQYIKAKLLGVAPYGLMSNEAKQKLSKLNTGKTHSEEVKRKLSEYAKKRGLGGHTSKQKLFFNKKNGDIIYLQSSYEIKFAQLLEDLEINWERPEPLIWFDESGKYHRYYPDFKIGQLFFDTKNDYLAIKDANKILKVSQQNNVKIEIVRYKDITEEYIKNALLV